MLGRALVLAPHSGKVHIEYARAQCNLVKNYELARLHYIKASELLREDSQVCFEVARVLHYNLREYGNAEAYYQKCLSHDPMHVQAMIQYGYLLLHALHRHTAAKRLLFRAQQPMPDDPDAKLGLAMVELIESGIESEARTSRRARGG